MAGLGAHRELGVNRLLIPLGPPSRGNLDENLARLEEEVLSKLDPDQTIQSGRY